MKKDGQKKEPDCGYYQGLLRFIIGSAHTLSKDIMEAKLDIAMYYIVRYILHIFTSVFVHTYSMYYVFMQYVHTNRRWQRINE